MAYKMNVICDKDMGKIKLVMPAQRVTQQIARMHSCGHAGGRRCDYGPDGKISVVDIKKFAMGKEGIRIAQAVGLQSRKIMVTFTSGRFQKWKEIMIRGNFYVATDLEIDTEALFRQTNPHSSSDEENRIIR